MEYSLIVSVDEDYGISREGQIPWNFPKDMAMFKHITMNMKTDYNKKRTRG